MEILILGGTGAMGVPLVNLLSKKEDAKVYVTTRSKKGKLWKYYLFTRKCKK